MNTKRLRFRNNKNPEWTMVQGGEYQYKTKLGVYEVIRQVEKSWWVFGPCINSKEFKTLAEAQKYVEEAFDKLNTMPAV